MLKYIIEFLFCSGLFIALYKLLIESRVSHSWARRYLLITMFVSLIIPTLELPLYPGETVVYEIPVFTPQVSPVDDAPAYLDYPEYTESAVAEPEEATYDLIEESHSSPIDWSRVLICSVWAIYFIITALNLARFAWRIYVIVKLRRRSQLTVYELYTLAVSENVREPFSFWRTIFMNRSMLAARESEQVIIHELSHIRHHHTAERLAMELLRCVAWFNPFVWLAGSALVEVHEWQADSDVLSEGYDVLEYRQLIFQQLFGYKPDLTNGLSSSQPFKKRFIMMTDFKKGKYSFLRLGATLPLVAAMILAFGAVRAEDEIVIKQPAPAVEVADVTTPTTEVTDATVSAQDSTMPIVSDDENPAPEPALISESDGDEEYNRKFTQATPLITLNHGTYVCVGYGLSDRVNQAETTALTKSLLATTFKVVSDTEIDVTTDAGWDFLKSGRYTYTLTRDTFTLKNKDASYSFKCEFTGPLYKATLKLIFDKQHEYFRNLIVIGPTETKDKEVSVSFGPNGTVYFNGEQTTIEELREKHYMNFNAPIVQPNGTLDGNMEDVIKEKQQQPLAKVEAQLLASYATLPAATTVPAQAPASTAKDDDTPFVKTTDIIRLTVDDKYLHIKEGEEESTKLPLAELSDDNFFPLIHKFIIKKASSKTIEQTWASGRAWSYPASNAVIVVDAKKGARVSSVLRAKELAYRAVVRLRVEVLKGQTKTVYGRLCEKDCEVLEKAIPMNVIITPEAQQILDISPRTDILYIVADQLPRFQGKEGKAANEQFVEWANNYLKQNKTLQKLFKEPWGSVFPLIIEKDGSIHMDKDLTWEWGGYFTVNDFLTDDLFAAAPKWNPAKHNGEPVRMKLDMRLLRSEDGFRCHYPSSLIEQLFTNSHSAKSVPRGVVENPKQKVLNDDDRCKIKITKVTLTDEQTVVDLHVEFWHNWWINIGNKSILQTHERIYPIQDVKGATMNIKYWMPESGKATFQLIFPPIECKTDKITFGEKGSWCIEDIDLRNLQPLDSKSVSAAIATPISAPKPQETPFVKISEPKPQDTPFVKTTDIIHLTVDGDEVQIKEGENSQTITFALSNLNSGNILTILQKFITETASSRTLKHKWAGGKEWSYPASNAVIVVDAKDGTSVADVRRVRDWARYAVAELRNRLSLEQVNVLYFYLCEYDCNLIERAVPTQVILTQNAQKILDLSPETDVIYSYVEQSPRFQGKQGKQAKEAFLEWMQSQKELYNEIFKNKPASYIYPAQFVIEKDGSVHLLSGLDRVLDGRIVASEYIPLEPIERLCAAAPKWTPAKRNGEPVRTQLTMYLSHRNDVRFGGWNSYHHSTTMSAPRGVVENPKQNANDNIKITKITFTDEQTVVDFRIWGPPTYWVRVQNNTALITGDARYPIRNVYGTKMDTKYWIPQSGDGTFQLIFPPINCKVDKLSFFEDSWRINDIDLSSLQNSEQNKPYIPRFADGEYRPIGLIKKHSKEEIHGLIYHLPTIKVKGNKIIVEGTHYKGFIKPGEYDYRILEKDMLHLIGDGIHYITSYEYSTLSTGANMLDIMIPINVKNTQIMGVMYTRQEWED